MHSPANSPAFTLIELLAVIAIAGLLAAMIIGLAGHAQTSARNARARAEIEKMHSAIQEHLLKSGTYPSNFAALTNCAVTNWLPQGFSFKDPWKRFYQYGYDSNQPNTYVLFSCGGDGETNTADDIRSGR